MNEKFFLQCAAFFACLVPISAGSYGIIHGYGEGDMDNHFRYLSGLLLGIGLVVLISIPKIEDHKRRFFLLTAIVFIGGLGRLYGITQNGVPSHIMLAALGMELVVTPLLCLWQFRIARKF